MKKLILVASIFVSLNANAALYDRGNGMIYDSDQNITWLQDANYAVTSGWAALNETTAGYRGPNYVYHTGIMGQEAAVSWANQLVYGGYDDWRLPTTGPNPDSNLSSLGELGYMYYVNLGNKFAPTSVSTSFIDASTGKIDQFKNVQDGYWFSEESGNPPIGAWIYDFSIGSPGYYNKGSSYYAWAVRDGDVAALPIPSAFLLLGSGLFGLLTTRRKSS